MYTDPHSHHNRGHSSKHKKFLRKEDLARPLLEGKKQGDFGAKDVPGSRYHVAGLSNDRALGFDASPQNRCSVLSKTSHDTAVVYVDICDRTGLRYTRFASYWRRSCLREVRSECLLTSYFIEL